MCSKYGRIDSWKRSTPLWNDKVYFLLAHRGLELVSMSCHFEIGCLRHKSWSFPFLAWPPPGRHCVKIFCFQRESFWPSYRLILITSLTQFSSAQFHWTQLIYIGINNLYQCDDIWIQLQCGRAAWWVITSAGKWTLTLTTWVYQLRWTRQEWVMVHIIPWLSGYLVRNSNLVMFLFRHPSLLVVFMLMSQCIRITKASIFSIREKYQCPSWYSCCKSSAWADGTDSFSY